MSLSPRSGVWRHRRGALYLVIGVGRLDDDDDEVVIYVRLYSGEQGGHPITVRRLSSFIEVVEWPDGSQRPRFNWVGETEPERAG